MDMNQIQIELNEVETRINKLCKIADESYIPNPKFEKKEVEVKVKVEKKESVKCPKCQFLSVDDVCSCGFNLKEYRERVIILEAKKQQAKKQVIAEKKQVIKENAKSEVNELF